MLTSLQTCFFVFPEQKYDFGIKETLTPLLFFLDRVCQRNESPSNIAPSSAAYPCFCIQYTARRVLNMLRQASKLICPGNMRFLILLGQSRPCFHG